MRRSLATAARLALLATGVLVCAATSAPRYRYVRAYPNWQLTAQAARPLGCASLQVWIGKTGKTGIGLSILATAAETSCEVTIEGLALQVSDETFAPTALPSTTTVRSDSPVHFYLPLEFDNVRLWNDGDRAGSLALSIRAGGASETLVLAVEQSRPGAHIRVDAWRQAPTEPTPPDGVRTVTPTSGSVPLEIVSPKAAP